MEGQPVFLVTILTIVAILQLNPNAKGAPGFWSKLLFGPSVCTGVDLNVGCVPAETSSREKAH
jgi:hypothetical protein